MSEKAGKKIFQVLFTDIGLLFVLLGMLLIGVSVIPVFSQEGGQHTALLPVTLKPPIEPICGEVVEFSGAITTDITLDPSKTYIINGDITVEPNASLTILPGTVLKFEYDRGIYVEGRLVAQGTSSNAVYFTSWQDDSLCGDTNGDASETVPEAGNWRWIEFAEESDANSAIRYAILRYGGRNYRPHPLEADDWRAPIRVFNVTPTFEYITIEHSYRNAVQLIGGDWTSQAITGTTVVYWIYDNSQLKVLPGNTLTIGPGVKIKVGYDHAIWVFGALNASGATGQPIVFTSEKDDSVCGLGAASERICDTNDDGTKSIPEAGDWQWIEFAEESDPNSTIRYAILRYGGRNYKPHPLEADDWRAPIRVFNVTPTFERLTIEHSYRNAVQLIGGDWTSQVITGTTVVYWIYDGQLNVLPGNTLTIEPGVKIKVAYDHAIWIGGALNASGTAGQPVMFTSEKDDAVCGKGIDGEGICDTNDDGTDSVPEMGDWQWIEFAADSQLSSTVRYALLRYGGRNYEPHPLYPDKWKATILIDDVSPTISHVLFENNHRAIDFYNDAAPQLECNDIEITQDTSWYTYTGMYNYNPENVVVATGHWWGDDSGPTHPSNPSGSGLVVGDGIDFKPWATSPCTDFDLSLNSIEIEGSEGPVSCTNKVI
ncbi:MAG: hypothetical protein R3C44_17450 [Chloroflexota bacterium]